MISTTTLTRAARVAFQGYLTAAFFKKIVVDRTIEVVSRSEKVSISLVTSTVCSSTAVLLIATTKAAQQFLSDDFQRVPVHKDIDDAAESNAPFAGGRVADAISTTKAFGAPAQPSSSRAVIESTEPAFDGPTKGLSTIDSDTTLIAWDEDLAKDVFSGDCVSDITDLDSESLADESTFYEDDCQTTAQCLTDDQQEHTLHAEYDSHTINNLIQRMSTLSLDVPSHLSSLSLDDGPSHVSPLDNVPSHLSPLDNVPSHIRTISLDECTLSHSNYLSRRCTLSLQFNSSSRRCILSPFNYFSRPCTLSLNNSLATSRQWFSSVIEMSVSTHRSTRPRYRRPNSENGGSFSARPCF
ncbi:hypothetical protein BDR03DRAFT_725133 [Suillus americanus]|nr:hypothetical protein BDR03DRAFT_725133 [Suillus americanus]